MSVERQILIAVARADLLLAAARAWIGALAAAIVWAGIMGGRNG